MTLNPKKNKTKNLEFYGTQQDFDVLADVLEQAAERLNVDIYPKDIDIPGRIVLNREGDATQWQYPKLSSALQAFANGLRGGGDDTVTFETPQITDDPKKIVKDSPTLRLMNQTSVGKHLGVGTYTKEDILRDFTEMLDPRKGGARIQPLTQMVPTWVYARNIVMEGDTPIGVVARDLETLAKIKDYPADLNMSRGLWSKVKKEGYNQAYFVIMRAEKDFDINMPTPTISGEWNRWIRSRPVPATMRMFRDKPPRTMGDYLERFAVYSTARTFGLKDAFLAPVFVGERWDGKKVGSSKDFADKILKTEPIKTKGSSGEYATYYGFVIIGKGPKRTPSLGKEKPDSPLDLPGFDV
jgi:hypothetical protein